MLIATTGAAIVFVVTLLFSPETRGKELVPQAHPGGVTRITAAEWLADGEVIPCQQAES
jgi:hypothetical protein